MKEPAGRSPAAGSKERTMCRILATTFAASALLVAESAYACGICFSLNGDALALPHPQAIELAVATRSAMDRGVLPTVASNTSQGWDQRKGHSRSARPWQLLLKNLAA